MHRLFAGVEPPEHVKDQLLGLMEGVTGARWQTPEQLHLTVRFIGEVDGRTAEDAALALAGLRHPGFEVALNGVGCFDRRGRPEALWVGIAPHGSLKTLHDKVDRALGLAGIAPDARAYLPHITLARLNGGAGPIRGWVERFGGVASAPWRVDALTLWESHLGRGGAHYEPVARWPLR